MPAAWVSAAVGVYGAVSAADAQSNAASATNNANSTAQDQLAFDEQKYNDQKPIADALGQQAVQTNAQQQAIAAQDAEHSQQAWTQNQQASAGVAPVVGLNALGGQYLSPEQQQELLGLQQALTAQGGGNSATGAPSPTQIQQPALSSTDQARMQELMNLQKTATTTGGSSSTGHWAPSQNDGGGDQWVADTPTAGTSSFTPAMQQELQALQQKSQAPSMSKIPGVAPTGGTAGLYNGMTTAQIQQRILQLQQAANQGAQQREYNKAGLITNTAAKYAGQETDLGEKNAQSILGDSQTLQDELKARGAARRAEVVATAHQRADDFEKKSGTQANAAIATSADAANRSMLRYGGDPNKMAAMGLDVANNQQLARISAGNQIAGINIASLNAADDEGRNLEYTDQNQAFGIQSSSLDAARASRTGAQQAALGMNYGAAQQADSLTGNAQDVADAKLNSLAQGSINQSQGFANTSGAQAAGAVAAGSSGVNNLNTGSTAGLPAAGLVNAGTTAVINASKAPAGTSPANTSAQVSSGLGTAAGAATSIYNNYAATGSLTPGLSSAPTGLGTTGGAYMGQDPAYDADHP